MTMRSKAKLPNTMKKLRQIPQRFWRYVCSDEAMMLPKTAGKNVERNGDIGDIIR